MRVMTMMMAVGVLAARNEWHSLFLERGEGRFEWEEKIPGGMTGILANSKREKEAYTCMIIDRFDLILIEFVFFLRSISLIPIPLLVVVSQSIGFPPNPSNKPPFPLHTVSPELNALIMRDIMLVQEKRQKQKKKRRGKFESGGPHGLVLQCNACMQY